MIKLGVENVDRQKQSTQNVIYIERTGSLEERHNNIQITYTVGKMSKRSSLAIQLEERNRASQPKSNLGIKLSYKDMRLSQRMKGMWICDLARVILSRELPVT